MKDDVRWHELQRDDGTVPACWRITYDFWIVFASWWEVHKVLWYWLRYSARIEWDGR